MKHPDCCVFGISYSVVYSSDLELQELQSNITMTVDNNFNNSEKASIAKTGKPVAKDHQGFY